MRQKYLYSALAVAALLAACASGGGSSKDNPMGFFVTSTNMGKGADLGGLEGADKHCQKLAASVGAGSGTWRAYLSTTGAQTVNARDRIGNGPWLNANGLTVANNSEELHGDNRLAKVTAVTEKGEEVKGRGDTPNQHDILTGSRPDGTAYPGFPGQPNLTCGEWTREANAFAMVGHHDRLEKTTVTDPWADSWNSSHLTVSCSKEDLPKSGGAGLFYCFAAD